MRQSSEKVPTDVGNRVVSFLRRLHPTKTAMRVAAETGCSADAVEKWLERASVPNSRAMLRLFLAYGPDFICAVVDSPPAWLDARQRAARQIELETGIARQRAELAQLREVPMTTATWRPNPHITDYDCDVLATDDDAAQDRCIAMVEDFGYAAYPCAINAKTGNLERGGPHQDRVAARQWAERVAGLHPARPSDERPAFYYQEGA